MVETILLVAEFNADGYDPRAKNVTRLLTVSVTEGGSIRVKIEAENPSSNNLGFVTLSDEMMPVDMFNQYVQPSFAALLNLTVRKGAL